MLLCLFLDESSRSCDSPYLKGVDVRPSELHQMLKHSI